MYEAGPRVKVRDEDGNLRPAEQRRADRFEQNSYGPRYIQFFFNNEWRLLAEKKPKGNQNRAGYELVRNAMLDFELFLIAQCDNLRGPRIYYSYSRLERPPRENEVCEWPDWVVDEHDSAED